MKNGDQTRMDPQHSMNVVCPEPALGGFPAWCQEELFTPPMIGAAALLERACDLHLMALYRTLDLASRLGTPRTAAELTAELGYVESARIAIEAMLLRLADRTPHVSADLLQEPPHFSAAQPVGDPADELKAVRRAICDLGEDFSVAIKFLDFGARHFVRGLRDDPDFMDRILSGRDPQFAKLWYRATNEDPLQDIHGKMGARVVARIFSGGRVLEVGGGTGNGMRHLLRQLADTASMDRIESYAFTDISLPFILDTRREVSRAYPSLKTEWRYLDINKPLREQKFNPGSLDLIYGVNAAHIARELALNLSVYHRTAAIPHPEYRPAHCYLAPSHWRRVLELAGFRNSCVCPQTCPQTCWRSGTSSSFAGSPERRCPPESLQYAAVVIARK